MNLNQKLLGVQSHAQQTLGKTCLPAMVEFIVYLCGFEKKFTHLHMYCKPTSIGDNFISQYTRYKLV